MKTPLIIRWTLAAAIWTMTFGISRAEVPPPAPAPEMESAQSSVTSDNLAASPLARLAKAIEDGDAETVAAFVSFPLKREAPIPELTNPQEFIDYFPVLFDEAFRQTMREGKFAKDWDEMGYRGVMYANGAIWVDGTLADGGEIVCVNYQSEAEKKLRNTLVEEERKTLPPSLADTCDPVFCFQTEDGEFVGRVDRLEGDTFRVVLFPGPAKSGHLLPWKGCQPSTIFHAMAIYEGSGGNHAYLDCAGRYALDVTAIGMEEWPELELFERFTWADAFEEGHPARYCAWQDLLEPPTQNAPEAPSMTPADAVRAFLDDAGIHYLESCSDGATVFTYAFAMSEESPSFPCNILVRDAHPALVARAQLTERIPANHRRDVAQCLLDLNRQRAAGSYRLDWKKRRVFCEFALPVESFSPDDPADALLFVAGPALWLDESRSVILAAAGLLPPPGVPEAENESQPNNSADDTSEAPPADLTECAPDAASDSDAAPAEACPWVAPFVQKTIEKNGTHFSVNTDDEKVTFQFRVFLGGHGLFTDATVSLSATENWVYLLLSPGIRISDALRAPVAEWAMRVTAPDDPAAFAWLEELDDIPRISTKTACPAQTFASDPDRLLLLMLQDAGIPFDHHSRSLAAVLSGLLSPAKALSATGEIGP